ncbi:MAG: hypothetical protein ACLGG7_13280 [Bacteriovoracia bacterium]
MLVLGDTEVAAQSVSVRRYGEMKSDVLPAAQVLELFAQLEQEKLPAKFR